MILVGYYPQRWPKAKQRVGVAMATEWSLAHNIALARMRLKETDIVKEEDRVTIQRYRIH